jgi:short-subunit dehydrogenase
VSLFMQGLRNRLAPAGVHVLTIKPGFVDTPMTSEFKKGLLWAQPDRVARDIQRAIEKKKDIAYVPPFWRYIMWVIGAIPEFVFKRLRL